MSLNQLLLPIEHSEPESDQQLRVYRDRLDAVLASDLDFHGQYRWNAVHNFHSFPAKFPPQLPRKFIEALTHPGDVVLDPMMGSGTTLLEAYLSDRLPVGFDIDPLALLLCQVKMTPLPIDEVTTRGLAILTEARRMVKHYPHDLTAELVRRFDPNTKKFIDYWFPEQSQIELLALVLGIESITEEPIRNFLSLSLSAIIITKAGGISYARDLAHTRPHKVDNLTLKSAIGAFEKRLRQNIDSISQLPVRKYRASVTFGDAQQIPLAKNSVDLIVTSPPYASNAIDYMRAHKFSLIWLGHSIDDLSKRRKEYVGGEALDAVQFETLPPRTENIITDLAANDQKKSRVLHRYYSEMTRVLDRMFAVLKPGKSAILVVGTSTFRGKDPLVQECLAEIGETIGFEVASIATRKLDRNRRMLPARHNGEKTSQIEVRMHEEYVIGYYKPLTSSS